jgi:hypothetical protein
MVCNQVALAVGNTRCRKRVLQGKSILSELDCSICWQNTTPTHQLAARAPLTHMQQTNAITTTTLHSGQGAKRHATASLAAIKPL